MTCRKEHYKLGQLWAKADMTGHMQREEGRKEVNPVVGGGGAAKTQSYHLLAFGRSAGICTLRVCVGGSLPQSSSCQRVSLLMVLHVTTVPPSFLCLVTEPGDAREEGPDSGETKHWLHTPPKTRTLFF